MKDEYPSLALAKEVIRIGLRLKVLRGNWHAADLIRAKLLPANSEQHQQHPLFRSQTRQAIPFTVHVCSRLPIGVPTRRSLYGSSALSDVTVYEVAAEIE